MADLPNAASELDGETDLHAELAAAFDSAAPAEPTAPVVDPQPDAAPAADAVAAERARDEAGRFAKAPESQAAPPADVDSNDPAPPAAPVSEEAVPPPILAPVSWATEDRAVFATLPPEAQKVIARRESERDRALTQKAEEAAGLKRRYDAIEQVMGPRRQSIALAGQTEAQVLQQFFALHDMASTDPVGYVAHTARVLGVDLAVLAAPTAQQPIDPHIQSLEQRIRAFEQTDAQRQRAAAEAQQRAQQQAHQDSLSDIDAFANETDFSGALVRPYFSHVSGDLLPITQQIRRSNPALLNKDVLQQAYDRAVWANPETRAAVQEHARKQDEAKQNREAAKKAADAKRAAVSVTGAPGGVAASGPKPSLREELEAAWPS